MKVRDETRVRGLKYFQNLIKVKNNLGISLFQSIINLLLIRH